MASRSGQFLNQAERAKLMKEIGGSLVSRNKSAKSSAREGNRRRANSSGSGNQQPRAAGAQQRKKKGGRGADDESTPCLVCLEDSDDANLLICDQCDGHFHRYCLQVPLKSIPRGDWYCGKL